MLTKKEMELERLDAARTQGEWKACNGGKCRCKQVWAQDYPIAKVEHGEWGDTYPALRKTGDELNQKVEAYIEHIPYGEISEDVATANAIFIAACSTAVPRLLADIKTLRELLSDAWTEYACHAPGCLGDFGRPCDCGYEEWLEDAKAATGEEPVEEKRL
mgnify:CR=1 FL=1